jgi:hypothetical protein
MPSRVTSARSETSEDVAFLSGAALAHLPVVLARADLPNPLLRDRLALRAAQACVAISGHPERAGDLREAVCLLRPGDLPGPAGAIWQRWRQAAARNPGGTATGAAGSHARADCGLGEGGAGRSGRSNGPSAGGGARGSDGADPRRCRLGAGHGLGPPAAAARRPTDSARPAQDRGRPAAGLSSRGPGLLPGGCSTGK